MARSVMTSYRNSDPRPPIMSGSPPTMPLPEWGWDRAPFNRWSFQHVRECVPTVEVWRGTGPVRPLPRNDYDFDMLPVAAVDGSPSTLAGLLDETYTDGVIALKNGAIVYERYYNGMGERTLHLSQSVAKSITASVAAVLIGRGLLDPSRPITDYLPELAETGWKGASLQHVLDMTTGVTFDETYENAFSEMGQLDVADGWNPPPPGSDPTLKWPRHVWELILTLKATERPHGAEFVYRSIETDVLAFAMERVTGKRLAQLVSEELWQKLGVEESAGFTVDSAGYALADGGFNATLRDYARFGQMILEGGGGIVPADFIEETRQGVHVEAFRKLLPDGAYRNQFWIEDEVTRNLMCRGVFGQLIWVNFDARMVFVKLSTWPDFLNDGYAIATHRAFQRIVEELT